VTGGGVIPALLEVQQDHAGPRAHAPVVDADAATDADDVAGHERSIRTDPGRLALDGAGINQQQELVLTMTGAGLFVRRPPA
jgi:hypothetical protein